MGAGAGKRRYVVARPDAEEQAVCYESEGMAPAVSQKSSGAVGSTAEVASTSSLPLRQRIKNFMGKNEELREFKPHVDFLRVIVSPSTRLELYLDTIIDEVLRILEAERCSVYFVDEIRKEVWCVGSTDCEAFRLPWDRGVVGQSAREGKLLNIPDVHAHESFDAAVEKNTGYIVRAMLSMPIRHMVDESRTVGVIQVLNKKVTSVFTSHDENELAKVAMVVSDSFYRQRWRAFETGARNSPEALAVIAAYDEGHMQKALPRSRSKGKNEYTASERFCWSERPALWDVEEAVAVSEQRVASTPAMALTGARMTAAKKLRTLEFNALDYTAEDLVHLVPWVMEDSGCLENCHVEFDVLRDWTWAARQLYRDNAYHNWFHGFSAFQVCYYQLFVSHISDQLRYLDVFGLLVAALCHDLDHPGCTNSFLVEGESELALRYNDRSVLENHHAFLACELLRKDESAIGAGLSRIEQQQLRQIMIKCILDTDMAHHREMCQDVMVRASSADSVAAAESPEDRQFWLSLCVHASDLSSQCLPWPAAKNWEECVSREFLAQADAELAAGMIPAPFMQFRFEDVAQRGKLQRNFIDFVLVPMWDPYTQLVPELRPCFNNLLHNRSLYDRRAVSGTDAEMESEDAADHDS